MAKMRLDLEKFMARPAAAQGIGAMITEFKAGFGIAVFIAFFAVLTWAGLLDEGWGTAFLLVAGAPFSVWAANAILKRDEEFRRR